MSDKNCRGEGSMEPRMKEGSVYQPRRFWGNAS